MTPRFPQIRGLVFDFDGTLVDASEPICRAFNSALQGFGAATMEPAAIRALIGRPLKEMFPRALPGLSETEIEQLITDYRAAFTPIATELSQPIPGLQAMLDHFHPHVRLGIATSRVSDGAHRILTAFGVLDRFDVIIGLGDVSQPKPHPEAVLKALERMHVPPAEAIMIGDIPADIEAGRAAGAATIGVVSDLHPADTLLSAGADAVIERLDQLIDLVGFTPATATDQSSFSTINR